MRRNCPFCDFETPNDNGWLERFSDHMKAAHPEQCFECGRQRESMMFPYPKYVSYWRPDGTCSHCGSIKPEALFKAIDEKRKIGPTDKSYKIYVDEVHENPDKMVIRSTTSADSFADETAAAASGYKPASKLKGEEREIYDAQYDDPSYKPHWVMFGKQGVTKNSKFYFQHLSKEEQLRFIEKINDKTMNIGYPGHFYVLPYFCARA